jgi:hypothetical protein
MSLVLSSGAAAESSSFQVDQTKQAVTVVASLPGKLEIMRGPFEKDPPHRAISRDN